MSTKKNLLLVLVAAFGLAGWLRAVSPVPYTETVSFAMYMSGDGATGMTIYEESGFVITWTFASGGNAESYTNNAIMLPGKVYTMAVNGSGTGYNLWTSFIAPNGYSIYVDGIQTTMLPLGWRSSFAEYHTIELRPTVDVNSPKPFGEFSGIAIGKSISWEIGLGTLTEGRSAGRLAFKEYDLSASPTSRAHLFLGRVNGLTEVWTINDGSSNEVLRQIIAPLGIVDLLDDGSGGYWIRFFAHSQEEGSPGNPFILYGSPWKTIHVESPGANQLKITETQGSATRVSLLSLTSGSVSSGNYVWTLQEGDGSTWLRTSTHSSVTAAAIATGGTVTTAANYTLHTFTANGTFSLSQPTRITHLLVGGGGGGGGGASVNGGGGGGGGGFVQGSSAFAAGSYSVTIGGGGAAGTAGAGGDGGASSVNSITAAGGGGGGGYGEGGRPGGSGGGAGRDAGYGGGTPSQNGWGGNSGGTSWGSAGGGGGAGTNGQPGGTDSGAWSPYYGNGGNAGLSTIYGDNRYYAGGGGGAWQTSGGGVPQGGSYGGNGSNSGGAGGDGTDGGGGGGGGGQFANGGRGGSGLVVLRYTNARDETVIVRTGGTSGTIVAKTKYHYEDVGGWGEEVTQVVNDPDSAALTTTYTYYTNSSDLGNYRRVRSVTGPTGVWSAQEYYNDWNRRGQLKYDYAPHLDLPATVPTTLDPAAGRVVLYDYEADWSGRHSRPNLREERVNDVPTAKTTWTSYGDTSAWSMPVEYWTMNSYSDASNYQSSAQSRFRADSWPTVAFHTYDANGADQSRIAWSQVNGVYDASTGAFSAATGISHIRFITLHGSTSSSGATSVSSWDSHTFGAIYLIPNQSTMDVSIWSGAGLPLKTETWVYTSSGFALVSWEKYTYNDQGQLTERLGSNGATTTNTYTNGLLTSTVDATGTETQFTYDILWRAATSVKKGAPSGTYAAQGDITTTYTYDGANHITQTVTSGGSLSLTASGAFDLAGRQTSAVAPGSYTTGYAYSSGGKVVTTTLPGGATRITETYLDGQPKQTTGTAVVNEYVTHGIDGSGNRTVAYRQASSTTTAVTTTTADWLGRKISFVQPGWSGSNTTQAWYYNSSGQLWKMTQPGTAPTLYAYDTLGRLYRHGLDVNTNDALDLGGTDRIIEYVDEFYLYAGVAWYRKHDQLTYATASSSTATSLGASYEQLSYFPSGQLSRTVAFDIYGNYTEFSTDVDRTNKVVTSTSNAPDSTTDAVQIAYNGLVVSSRSKTNLTTTFGFDALGRPTTSTDPRTGTTTTAYISGTNQVSTVTDPASIVQATYTYDSAGRVSSMKDALNKYAYTSYTTRGEVYRQWGDTAVPVEYGYDNWGRQTTMKTYRAGSGWTASSWPGSPGTADTTTWNFNEATGLLASKTDAASKSVSYTYTQARQIDVRTWARGVTTDYDYSTTTGELTSVNYSDSTTDLTYTYNRLGKVATVADAIGTRTFNYNLGATLELQNEVLGTSSSDFYGDMRISRGYGGATGTVGRYNRLGIGNSSNAYASYDCSFGYDAYGRINKVFQFNYTYVANSNLIGSINMDSSSWTQTRTYLSNRDLLDTIETKWSTTSKAKFDYGYDNLGRITQVAKTGEIYNVYGNGSQGLDTYYGYDDRSQVTSEVTKLGGSSTVLTGRNNSAFAYDTMGNRSSTTHNGTTSNYSVNALNQYTQRDVPGAFDVAGSDAATTVTVAKSGGPTDTATRHGNYFFDAYALTNTSNPVYTSLTISGSGTATLPAYVAKTPESFASGYDDDGNLLLDGRWNYTYDAENRLISAETNSASVTAGVPRQKLLFVYDYLGRRVSKLAQSGWTGSGYATIDLWHRYLYDGWNLLWEFDAANSLSMVHAYSWGLDNSGTLQGAGGVGGLLFTWDFGNSVHGSPITDGMGNVHGQADYYTGNVQCAFEYDAFGQVLRESGSYAGHSFVRFSSKFTDLETSLVYYGLRYYSPSLGRFINKDPIEEQGGKNLYAFCGNNGVNYWDVLGRNPATVPLAIGGAIINGTLEFGFTFYYSKRTGAARFWEAGFAGVGGVVSGAITGAVASTGVGLGTTVVWGGAANGIGEIISQSLNTAFNGGSMDERAIGASMAFGALGSVAEHAAGAYLKNVVKDAANGGLT